MLPLPKIFISKDAASYQHNLVTTLLIFILQSFVIAVVVDVVAAALP